MNISIFGLVKNSQYGPKREVDFADKWAKFEEKCKKYLRNRNKSTIFAENFLKIRKDFWNVSLNLDKIY